MFKFNSLAACSSASDLKNPEQRDVVDLFGVDASSGDILQLHLEQDIWKRVRMTNPYAEQRTRFSGPVFASALNPDRVDLLGASPQGEMLHCYTDPQMWYAEDPKPNSVPPNAQTTGGWWTWTSDGQSRLDLFAVTADKSAMVQYTAMDPGASKAYTWNSNPLGNPASFTDGALTWCSGHLYRMDIFGVQASGKAAQLYFQWPPGWNASADLGASYPVGTTLVSCSRESWSWDVFGIDENGKILSFYWYFGRGWATRQFDMPVSGDWKLSSGCTRARNQIDLFFVDAAGGILRVSVTYSNEGPPTLDSELIYPFRLRPDDLKKFKAMFPDDKDLQKVSIDDLIKYSQGKDPDGDTAQPSSDPPPQSQRGQFSDCAWAKGAVVLDVAFLLLGLRSLRNKNLVLNEAIARGAELTADIEHAMRTIADSSASVFARANAVREIGVLIYSGGLIEPIYKAIMKSLTWWDMVLYGVAGLAEISAAFLTDGAAVIALIIYELSMAGFLVSDVVKAIEVCG